MRPIDADVLKQDLTRFYDNEVTAKELIDEQPTVGGWVSVEDRLPEPVCARYMEDIKPVLLYSPKGGYYVGWYYGPNWNGKKLFINRTSRDSWQYITTKVTHWMPLPEQPEVSE